MFTRAELLGFCFLNICHLHEVGVEGRVGGVGTSRKASSCTAHAPTLTRFARFSKYRLADSTKRTSQALGGSGGIRWSSVRLQNFSPVTQKPERPETSRSKDITGCVVANVVTAHLSFVPGSMSPQNPLRHHLRQLTSQPARPSFVLELLPGRSDSGGSL